MIWGIGAMLAGAVAGMSPDARKPDLMPLPRAIAVQSGTLAVTGPFAPRWAGCGNAKFLADAARRLQTDVSRQTGLILEAEAVVPLTIRCSNARRAVDADEGYALRVTAAGIAIEAGGPAGVLRAFATLRQLVGLSPKAITLPMVSITDGPRFAWRGVMLDPARHFIEVTTLKRQIDAMERVKLNVLHLHLSDDEGFRVESRRYPKLTRGRDFYTQAEIRDLVAYAADRGVRIVPEFDVPGHSRAIVAAYPELGVVGKKLFLGRPDVALNPAVPQTYRFLTGLFNEMAALFPDPHFHVGGDEVAKDVWEDSADVRALMAREKLSDRKAVEGSFMRRVREIVIAAGKQMIGWEEVAATGVPTDAIVQAWQTSNAVGTASAKGHRTIVSAGYYLNLLMPAGYHYAIDPLAPSAAGLTPEHALRLRKRNPLLAAMVTDALVDFPRGAMSPEQEARILGGEATLWGEIVDDTLIDQQLWPRAAAMAERFWSPASAADVPDMYRRLATVSDQLSVAGLADRATRQRMAARLSPGDSDALETLLAVTGPVRNMAHDHRIKAMLAGKRIVQPLNDLADAAPVDSLVAHRFTAQTRAYANGDRSQLAPLRAQLTLWRVNDARFIAIASGKPMLEAALPASRQVAALAEAGLAAVDAIEAGKPLDAKAGSAARALLDALAVQEAASWRPFDAFLNPQPPADLIVKIGPGLRILIDAATRSGSSPS